MNHNNKIILASASPRRFELLSRAGFAVQIEPADIVEDLHPNETPEEMVARLAKSKALVVAQRFPSTVVVAGDTTVVLAGENLSKPEDAEDAFKMLSKLQGNWHTVFSATCVQLLAEERAEIFVSRTEVKFTSLSAAEIRNYIASGEPLDKAGAYGIQELGAQFIEEIKGSYTNVVGIDLARTVVVLKRFNLLPQFV